MIKKNERKLQVKTYGKLEDVSLGIWQRRGAEISAAPESNAKGAKHQTTMSRT